MATTSSGVSGRTFAKVGAGFVVAAVVLYLLGRVVGWGEILRAVRSADPLWLGLAVASTAGGLVAWSRVWDDVLASLSVDLPFASVTATYVVVTFADYVTPLGVAGGGPFVAYFLSSEEEVSFHEGLASITSTDVLNLVPQFAFAAVGIGGLVLQGDLPRQADLFVAGLAGFAVAAAAGVAVVLYRRDDAVDLVVAVASPVARALPFVDTEAVRTEVREFSDVVGRIADDPKLLERSVAYSFVGWALFAAPLYLSARSIGVALSPPLVLFVVAASTLASLVPTPGGLGGVEFAMTGLLVALSPIGVASAAAATLLYRVTSYWIVVVVGGPFTLYEIYSA